jgi:ABC-type glycerol-3-phosphate transport system substrate-binding protein
VYGTYVDPDWFITSGLLYANGASILSDDLSTAQVDSPAVIETLHFMQDLVWKYKVAPQPGVGVNSIDLFMAGKIATFMAGRWPIQSFASSDFQDYQTAPLPFQDSPATVLGTDGFGITTSSPNVDLAWALIRELGKKEIMALDPTGEISGIPSRRSLATGPGMDPPSNFATFYDALKVAKSVQAGSKYPELSDIWNRYLSSIMANETTVEDAAAKMQAEMTDVLSRP